MDGERLSRKERIMPHHPMGEILRSTAAFLADKWRNRNDCCFLCGDCTAWYQPEGKPEEGFCMKLKTAMSEGGQEE
jgi:hypothetical protein